MEEEFRLFKEEFKQKNPEAKVYDHEMVEAGLSRSKTTVDGLEFQATYLMNELNEQKGLRQILDEQVGYYQDLAAKATHRAKETALIPQRTEKYRFKTGDALSFGD